MFVQIGALFERFITLITSIRYIVILQMLLEHVEFHESFSAVFARVNGLVFLSGLACCLMTLHVDISDEFSFTHGALVQRFVVIVYLMDKLQNFG